MITKVPYFFSGFSFSFINCLEDVEQIDCPSGHNNWRYCGPCCKWDASFFNVFPYPFYVTLF